MTKSIVLTLALGLTAQAWAKTVEIKSFTPQSMSETTNQIRAVFSGDVVNLNEEEDANTVFDLACTPAVQGRAQWDDTKTWVFDFQTKIYQNNLPGGTKCTVTLNKQFKTAKGVTGRTSFNFTIDGPNVLAAYPGDRTGKYVEGIQEDQIVVLGFDAAIDEASVKKNVYFKVKGIASQVGVTVIGEAEKRALMKSDNFPSGLVESLPYVILVKPVTNLPNDKTIDLVVGAGVQSKESGAVRNQDLKIPYQSRKTLNATFSCTRENAAAGCSPFSPMELIFSAPIKIDQAKEIYLQAADGTIIKAEINAYQKGDSYIQSVTFPAQYKDNQSYRIVLPNGISDDSGRVLQNGAAIAKANVTTGDYPPLAKFSGEFGLIEASEPVLPATLRNLEARVIFQKGAPTEIQGSSVRLDSGNFKDIVKWMKKLDLRSRDIEWGTKDDNRRGSIFGDLSKEQKKATSRFEIPLSDSGKAFEVVRIDLKKTGFHVVELQSKILGNSLIAKDATMYVPTSALVTNMVVHSKWGRESSLFWVTQLDSGRVVEGAQVVVYDCAGNAVFSGNTDAQGLLKVAGSQLNGRINRERCGYEKADYTGSDYDDGFYVSAKKGEDFTFTFSGWKEGIEPFRFGYNGGTRYTATYNAGQTLFHTVLDRTLFRAGETVGMKFFLRVPTGAGLAVPRAADMPNQVRISNYDTETDYVFPIALRADGTGELEFTVPKDAKLGSYNIALEKKVGEDIAKSYSSYDSFSVLEFKVPLLKGSITFPKTEGLVQPGELNAKLSLNYMDGSPVQRENVKFRYIVSEGWGKYFDGMDFTFGTKKVAAGQKNLNEEQESNVKTFERPVRLDDNGARIESISELSNLDGIRNVEAQLEFVDKNGETQNVSRTVTVYPAALLTGVKIQDALGSKKQIKFQVAVVDLNGKPVQGATPSVRVYERIVYTHKTSMVGGFYTSSSTQEIKAVGANVTCGAQTDKKGIVDCQAIVQESGSYIVESSIRDQDANISYGSAEADVTGARMWFPAQNSDRIDLVPESKEVEAGQQAVFRVETEFDNATVLVTVEREGVLDQFVTTINTRDPRIRVPMKAEYTPNVYVSAMVVRGRISQNQATAVIDPGKPAYQIGLSSINVNRAPNTLKVAIRTLDKNGAATTKFKPRQTVKAEVTISKWAPRGQTPAANAEFALAVIDKGLLQLSKNNTWNLLDAMLGSRELEVETATAQMQVIGKRHYGVKAKPTGGDGAADMAALMGQSRELFDTRLTWVGRVVTDAAGKATVEFQTNDSPTEFVIVAIANQGADKFGQGEASIVSQPDIMVLPAIGTVVRDGDVFAQEFTLRNTTEAQQKLSVSGQVTFTLKDGKTQVVAVPAQSAEIGPRGDVMMNLGNVTVPDGAVKSQVVYTVTNGAGQKVDEIKLTQEVKPSVIPRVWAAQLNQMTSPVNFTSFIPNDVKPGESLIKVQMLPSLAAGLESVKDDFASYPYQSLELIASRAAATANQELWNDAMRRLPAHLDSNGLVMFFPGSSGRGSDALTAYIMSIANYSGMEIPEESLERMISGLTAIVEGRKAVAVAGETQVIAYIRRVNAIEVLNRYGRAQAEWLTALPAIENSQVPTTTLVDLLSIYANMEVEGGAQKLEEVTARLQARMTRTRTEMKFTAQAPRYWFMLTSADAEQLDLINVISRNDYLAAQWSADAALLIQGAANMMKAGSWDLTVANAIGVLAFKAFAAQFEAGTVTGDTAISIGTRVAATWNWNAKPEGGVLASPTQPGNVAVNLTHTGTGAPWAITSVIYAQPLTQKKESHISVTKTVTPQKAVYKKGDVVTITLKIQPQTDMPMVSIMDPIPAGAKILGTGLDNDREQGAVIQQGWAWPDYEAKTYDAYNLSFYEIPAGGVTVAYKVQLNNAGTFKLPATRVEAIYAPENFAEVPNAPVSIQPK